jgi:hypothetical protein
MESTGLKHQTTAPGRRNAHPGKKAKKRDASASKAALNAILEPIFDAGNFSRQAP